MGIGAMDPNATLQMIARLYQETQDHFGSQRGDDAGGELDQACDDLLHWLSRGGFEPNWDSVPNVVCSYLKCRQISFAKSQLT